MSKNNAVIMLVLLGSCSRALGTSWACGSVAYRIVNSDAVVVGRTVSEERREFRPRQFVTVYAFEIEEVIKGEQLRAGDVHKEECWITPWGGTSFLPPKQWGRCVIYFSRGAAGTLYAGPCNETVDAAKLVMYRRMADVAARPDTYLNSTDSADIEVILNCIQRYHVPRNCYPPLSTTQPAPLIDRNAAVEYLHRQIDLQTGQLYSLAVQVISEFPTRESFDRLASALKHADPAVIHSAARGLGRLGDSRASRLIVDRYRQLLRNRGKQIERFEEAFDENGKPYRKRVMQADLTFDNVQSQLVSSLENLRDRDGLMELLGIVDSPSCFGVGLSLGRLGDERAARPLLACTWSGHGSAEPLIRLSDPRIVTEARERAYDNPLAPRILAGKGDPQVREFMVRLIRQGHEDGARWAATTRDRSLHDDLMKALPNADLYPGLIMAYALGRQRAFDVLPMVIDAVSPIPWNGNRTFFLMGLVDKDVFADDNSTQEEFIAGARKHVGELAITERWSDEARTFTSRLLDAVEADQRARDNPDTTDLFERGPWTAPAKLPDMPDPYDRRSISEYLSKNLTKAEAAVRMGPGDDRRKIAKAMWMAKVKPNADLIVDLLLDPSAKLNAAAHPFLVGKNAIAFSPEQLRRLALNGDFIGTRTALHYMREHARIDDAPTVTEVMRRGWHLYDPELYKAVIATKATGCIPLLRSYLNGQHIDLRRRAALTLAELGDNSGKAVLRQEDKRSGLQSPDRQGVQRALRSNSH